MIDVEAIRNEIESHAASLGEFDTVLMHEPKSAPSHNFTLAVMFERLDPIPARSSLNKTTVRLSFIVRLYMNMLREPQDVIDADLLNMMSTLMAAYSGDFSLNDHISNVDLLGAHGVGLIARAGYISQDRANLRVVDITLPLVINDAFSQRS